MRVWSQGLGKRTLDLDLGEGEISREGDDLLIRGLMGEPVWWEYTVRLTEEDIVRVFRLAICRTAVDFVVGRKDRWKLVGRLSAECLRLPALLLGSLWCSLRSSTPNSLPGRRERRNPE